MKKICIVIVSFLLVGMLGCGSGSLPKETVQKVSEILEEAVEVTRSADPDEYKVHQVDNLTYIATLYEKAGLRDQGAELIPLAIQLMRETQNNPKIEKGDIIIINSGWHKKFADHPDYYFYTPGLYKEAAEWFVEKGVRQLALTSKQWITLWVQQ